MAAFWQQPPQAQQQTFVSPYTYSNPYAQNPYSSVMASVRTPQLPSQSVLPGRIISSEEEIVPNEVSMDGSVSLFPSKDYSCIYAKAWNKQGLIDTVKYVPEKPQPPVQEEKPDPFAPIMERLERIEQNLGSLTEAWSDTK